MGDDLSTMKNIDIKSIIIGGLLTSTIFLGVAATSKADAGKWDDKQEWVYTFKKWHADKGPTTGTGNVGFEPFAIAFDSKGQKEFIWSRKRIK